MSSQVEGEEVPRASLDLLYQVSQEFATIQDLQTVLRRVVLLSMQAIGATNGSVIVLDDTGRPQEAIILVGEQSIDRSTQRLKITLDKGLTGWVARNQKLVHIDDTSQDVRWLPRTIETQLDIAPKSVLSAPLLVHDRLVGVLTLAHPVLYFFRPNHIALFQAIADQAGIAVLNARLYADSQRQARAMTALAESAASITSSLDLQEVLLHILEQISHALDVQAVSLALLDTTGEELVFRAATGWAQSGPPASHLAMGRGLAGWTAQTGQGGIYLDPQQDQHYDAEIENRTGLKVRAVACAPIREQNRVLGILEAINPRQYDFPADTIQLLSRIGGLAGTAIRHAQLFERLQAAHQRYRELFEDNIDPIVLTDLSGQILETNRQACLTTGYDQEALLQMNIRQFHPADFTKLEANLIKLHAGETISYEFILPTFKGMKVPVQVNARQVMIGDTSYLQWIFRDLTERKRLDSMRDDLLSMIYHDIQSPLSNVISSLDLAESFLTSDSDPDIKSVIEIAFRSTQRIQRLTKSLLDINRLEAGQPLENLQPTRPERLAEEAIQNILPLAEDRQQVLVNSIPPDLPSVLVNAEMIERVLTNLLENAVKYSPPHGHILVGGKREGLWVTLWVEDEGPGIPPEDQERIFDKFTRLADDRIRMKGFGIGLAFCRLAIEAHGGKIWVENKLGEGSIFLFTLPVA